MKKYILLLSATLFSLSLSAQTPPSWQWAKTIGWNLTDNNGRGDAGNGVATDAAGNVYVTGEFLGDVDFGDGNLISSYGNADMYLVSYDCSGNFRWVVRGGTMLADRGIDVAVGKFGDVYIAGAYMVSFGQDSVRFGDTTFTGRGDFFFAKYDTAGNFHWLRNTNLPPNVNSGGQRRADIDFDGAGSPYVISETFSSSFPGYNFSGIGFMAKYDTAGNLVRVSEVTKPITGNGFVTSLAVDSIGNAYVGGYFADSVVVAGVQLVDGGVPLANNAFVCKFDTNGNTSWVRQGHSFQNTHVRGSNLALSKNEDRLYITGDYSGDIAYGNDTLISPGTSATTYLFVLDSAGNNISSMTGWSQGAVNQSGSITLKDNKIAISGIVYSSLTWGGQTISSVLGQNDPFIALMDTALNVDTMYVIPVFGNSPAPLSGLAYDENYNLYISGTATGTVYLPTDTAYFKGGNTDALLAKFGTSCAITSINNELVTASNDLRLLAYPNPTDGQLTLRHDMRKENAQLLLYDMQGRMLLQRNIRQGSAQTELDLSGMSAGLYLVSVVTESGRSSLKIILSAE